MQGETQTPPASALDVLGDDDLLAEIIIHVGCPASLVRAAAVCTRWIRLVSDRAFLRRFRKLHPPRLLGFYLGEGFYRSATPRFFPMLPQPLAPELDAIVRHACFTLEPWKISWARMVGCWNGHVLTSRVRFVLNVRDGEIRQEIISSWHSPLCPQRGMAGIPTLRLPPTPIQDQDQGFCTYRQLFFKEEGKVLSYFYVMVNSTSDETESTLRVYSLQNHDDVWRTHLTLVADYFVHARSIPSSLLTDDKIYMASALNEIIVLDLAASGFTTIQLPQGVDFGVRGTTMLSRGADDDASAVYLIHAKEFQIHIWLHKGGSSWLLVDTICLREMCAPFLMDEPTALLHINHMGDYTGEFMFLEMGRCALYLDVKHKTLRKVYEMTKHDRYFGHIYPFMMIWPPTFPALKDRHARFASRPFDDVYSALVEFRLFCNVHLTILYTMEKF